ncbi:MAG: hypothetical protein ABI895_16480 [Deltaproteobacteria bacterium]
MQDRRPKLGVNQDSWAWNVDSHELGNDYFQAHLNAPGTLSGEDLTTLAQKLFQEDPDSPSAGELFIYQLQSHLRNEDPAIAFSADATSKVNALITKLIGDGKDHTLSHAQMVQFWHVLVAQEDMRLLAPKPPGSEGW